MGLTKLIEVDVDKEPEPQGVEEMEFESLLAVEDPQPEEEAVDEVQDRADISRS